MTLRRPKSRRLKPLLPLPRARMSQLRELPKPLRQKKKSHGRLRAIRLRTGPGETTVAVIRAKREETTLIAPVTAREVTSDQEIAVGAVGVVVALVAVGLGREKVGIPIELATMGILRRLIKVLTVK